MRCSIKYLGYKIRKEENMASSLHRAALSQLKRLMLHIIKWFSEPSKRSDSWTRSIIDSRKKLKRIEKKKPSANRKFLRENWDATFKKAKQGAENEMNAPAEVDKLTEKQVFDDNYTLDNE